MEAFKKNWGWLAALVVTAGVAFYAGKDSNPARVETVEAAKAQEAGESKDAQKAAVDAKAAGESMVQARRLTKTDTKANGDKMELTLDEFVSLTAFRSQVKAEAEAEARVKYEKMLEAYKATTSLNNVVYVRAGAAVQFFRDGLPNPKGVAELEGLATASYGAWEVLGHSNFKGSGWAGVTWGIPLN
jgi:hypothetical protein